MYKRVLFSLSIWLLVAALVYGFGDKKEAKECGTCQCNNNPLSELLADGDKEIEWDESDFDEDDFDDEYDEREDMSTYSRSWDL